LATGTYYFSERLTGYLPEYDSAPEFMAFVDAAKGFFGLCSVLGILRRRTDPLWSRQMATAILVYRATNNKSLSELLPYRWLTKEESALFGRTEFNEAITSPLLVALDLVRVAFNDGPTRNAARWLAESEAGSDGLMQIVQSAIALEIIFGDEDEAKELGGVTALLANRLAFLVARTAAERRQIMFGFKEAYKVRSQIVHRGRSILNEKERNALYVLREYAHRAILRQTEQLLEERAEQRPSGVGPN